MTGSSPVSVVTVNFNAGDALQACVRSVLASTVAVEVVVVDNGSTDGSLERLRRDLGGDPRALLLEMHANLGFAAANNRGLLETRGEFVLLLNPDCQIEPATIERMRAVLELHPEAGMAGGLVRNPDGSEQAGCRRRIPTPGLAFGRAFGLARLLGPGRDFVLAGAPLPSEPTEVEAISGAFMFVRRRAMDAVGPLDERYFLHCEDLDWCLRFRQAGYRVLFVPGVVIRHEKGRSSRDRPVRVLWHKHRGMVRFYRKFFKDAYPAPLMWLVFAGIGVRFVALASLALVRRGLGRDHEL
jgi:GT2 family glycosyltransferase